jgi:hypothetical protein
MKSINTPRNVQIKYPRNTPRISRKRLWMDRSEWREAPNTTFAGATGMIDSALDQARNQPELSQSPTEHLKSITNDVGRLGIRKV